MFFLNSTKLIIVVFCLRLSIVLLPVSNAESTPTILEVDFFNVLVSVKQNACLDVEIVVDDDWYSMNESF